MKGLIGPDGGLIECFGVQWNPLEGSLEPFGRSPLSGYRFETLSEVE